jgi:hypothetical protein
MSVSSRFGLSVFSDSSLTPAPPVTRSLSELHLEY